MYSQSYLKMCWGLHVGLLAMAVWAAIFPLGTPFLVERILATVLLGAVAISFHWIPQDRLRLAERLFLMVLVIVMVIFAILLDWRQTNFFYFAFGLWFATTFAVAIRRHATRPETITSLTPPT